MIVIRGVQECLRGAQMLLFCGRAALLYLISSATAVPFPRRAIRTKDQRLVITSEILKAVETTKAILEQPNPRFRERAWFSPLAELAMEFSKHRVYTICLIEKHQSSSASYASNPLALDLLLRAVSGVLDHSKTYCQFDPAKFNCADSANLRGASQGTPATDSVPDIDLDLRRVQLKRKGIASLTGVKYTEVEFAFSADTMKAAISCLIPQDKYASAAEWLSILQKFLPENQPLELSNLKGSPSGERITFKLRAHSIKSYPQSDFPYGVLVRGGHDMNKQHVRKNKTTIDFLVVMYFTSYLYVGGINELLWPHYIPLYTKSSEGNTPYKNTEGATHFHQIMMDLGMSALPVFMSSMTPSEQFLLTMSESVISGYPTIWIIYTNNAIPKDYEFKAERTMKASLAYLRNVLTTLNNMFYQSELKWREDSEHWLQEQVKTLEKTDMKTPWGFNSVAEYATIYGKRYLQEGLVCPRKNSKDKLPVSGDKDREAFMRTHDSTCEPTWVKAARTKPHIFGQPFLYLPKVYILQTASDKSASVDWAKIIPNIVPDVSDSVTVFYDMVKKPQSTSASLSDVLDIQKLLDRKDFKRIAIDKYPDYGNAMTSSIDVKLFDREIAFDLAQGVRSYSKKLLIDAVIDPKTSYPQSIPPTYKISSMAQRVRVNLSHLFKNVIQTCLMSQTESSTAGVTSFTPGTGLMVPAEGIQNEIAKVCEAFVNEASKSEYASLRAVIERELRNDKTIGDEE